MAFMSELDVINDQLATLGESPLNEIDEDHPMVAGGLRMLRVASYREQAKGWWFNKETVTLTVDPISEKISVPSDCISVDPVSPYENFVQRGRFLYDPKRGSSKFTQSVVCKLIRHVPFEDLPVSAATYIGVSAVLKFQQSYDADQQKTKDLKEDLGRALVDLNSEHIRNINANMLNNPSVAGKAAQLGGTLARGGLRNY